MSDTEEKGPTPEKPFRGFKVEIDPEKLEETIRAIRAKLQSFTDQVQSSVISARYMKVKLSYKGKQVMPPLPLSVFLATEGATFWLLSPLAALMVNLGAKAFLDIELIHDADKLVEEGLNLYLDGEVEQAEAKYREALKRREDDPSALYNLGVLLRVSGRKDEALENFRAAAMGPEGHPDVVRASEAIERMKPSAEE